MVDERRSPKVALIGCGNLGTHIARGIARGAAGSYCLAAVLDPSVERTQALAAETGAVGCPDLDALLGTAPEYVIEAATGEVLQAVALRCLGTAHLVVLSTGALADDDFRSLASRAAEQHGRKIYVASGALGGFDLAQAARVAGALNVTLRTQKPPRALAGAPSLGGRALPEDREEDVFRGSAREAIAAFPQNVNVAVALSLAGVGLDHTAVTVTSKPGATRNRHIMELEGAFGSARIEIEARPSPDNPKSSLLAAYSVLALLRKLRAPIEI
jgi:aspartate dehydrogenase